MTSWQKRARLVVLAFGIAVAAVVYFAMGERVKPVVAQPVDRFDKTATIESAAGFVERVQGGEREFLVSFARSARYEDNTTRMFEIRIVPPLREGRQFIVTANEGLSGQQQRLVQLAGDVEVEASDGFKMTTEAGTFNQDDGVAKAPAMVQFGRGRMSGSGRDVSYDTNNDVLVILDEPRVVTTSDVPEARLEFTAGTATLDRTQHLLTLEGMVHILRGTQTFESDRAVAFLNDGNDVVTRIEMRGNSRVSGESQAVAAMAARDIDLDYTDDGETLETAALQGGATLTMTGQNGAAGRQMSGERLELTLDPEGYLTKAVGIGSAEERVTLALPADDDVPGRTIRARHLDATGVPGRGLTAVRFTDAVEFLEPAARTAATNRLVTANVLRTTMEDDRVTGAFFTGDARFVERGLLATAPTMNYLPEQGRVELRDSDAKGGPHIEDERMVTDAGEISVTLNPRHVRATRGVRTTLRAPTPATAGATAAAGSRLPGVFDAGSDATVTAQDLDYSGQTGRTVYSGSLTRRAQIYQGANNTIVADRIELDQETGDLVAVGNAATRLALASGESNGAAREIRFDNEQRTIRYSAAETTPASGSPAPAGQSGRAGAAGVARGAVTPGPGARAGTPRPTGPLARLHGGEGDLNGETITVSLASGENRVEQVEVTSHVSVVLDRERQATGDYLVYRATAEEYELTARSPSLVTLIERRPPDCYEFTGRRLTYHRPTSRMSIDGRSQTQAGASRKPCIATPAR